MLAREGEQKREAQTAHRQTDSAVAQLRTMQEHLDSLEVSSQCQVLCAGSNQGTMCSAVIILATRSLDMLGCG